MRYKDKNLSNHGYCSLRADSTVSAEEQTGEKGSF